MVSKGVVYLLHFSRPYRHAAHYLGWTTDLEARLSAHRAGNGARLMEVVSEHGIDWELARTWEGNRKLERKLKSWKSSRKLCPVCRGESKGAGDDAGEDNGYTDDTADKPVGREPAYL